MRVRLMPASSKSVRIRRRAPRSSGTVNATVVRSSPLRGASSDCAQIQLKAPLDENSTIAKFIDKRGEGIQHIAFQVDDLEGALANLEAKGVALIDHRPRLGAGGKKIAFLHPKDTYGVLIELCEPARGPAD